MSDAGVVAGTEPDVPGNAAAAVGAAEGPAVAGECGDLLATLSQARFFLRFTTRDLTDEQAAGRTTVSALCLGGLIKHVARVEEQWLEFVARGPDALSQDPDERDADFRLGAGETLAGALARYEQVARRTDDFLASRPDLDVDQPLPVAPWFPPGARWSVRRVILHVIAETAHHSGHADVIRECLDGAKTMG
ncbi:DinB family protein [Pseudofrankia sp. DC12]|uniref:DinB family protein n=1 Tax=Pseudofrankia sp. DC12 TaxID=683315 RepID=UPI0009FD87F6|nr:DinB family protein [Pseudofrankia sp. DC12]